MSKRLSVLVLFGGESSEHDVSIRSARNVYEALDQSKYNITLCYISQSGVWQLIESIEQTKSDETVRPDLGMGALISSKGRELKPDVLLPILHGKNGEDGAVQGLAQLLHIPIVGCDMTSSVLAMDKTASKALFNEAGLSTLPYLTYRSHDAVPSYSKVSHDLGDVVFVKPSRAGSSVGVSRVTSEAEYSAAISEAVKHDSLVLIEKAAVSPREVEVAVLGNAGSRTVSLPGEIQPDGSFYSYESKYNESSQSILTIPAKLGDVMTKHVQDHALRAYDALHCQGLARVDFLLEENGNCYINEINTMPGFTNISMYPKLWQASGLSYGELLNQLIYFAILQE